MHFQSLIKIFLSCALTAWTCQTFGAPQQAEGSLSVDNMEDAIPLDRSLQAYYIHYVHDMGKKGDEIACYLKALAQGEVGVEEMPEWLQGIENDQEKLKRFYTMLYLVYWYNAERRREILSFLENVNLRQRGALTLGEPPLQMMMRFNALSSDFEPLTSFLLENGTTIRIHTWTATTCAPGPSWRIRRVCWAFSLRRGRMSRALPSKARGSRRSGYTANPARIPT